MVTLQLVQLLRVILLWACRQKMEPRMSSGTRHFHEMRVFVRPCVAAHHLFARTHEAQRERDGPSSLGLTSLELLRGTYRWLQ